MDPVCQTCYQRYCRADYRHSCSFFHLIRERRLCFSGLVTHVHHKRDHRRWLGSHSDLRGVLAHARVLPGWGRSILMYSQSASGSFQPGERPATARSGDSRSSVYRWYPQLDHHRFVYATYRTMKATRSRHGWVHMFITHFFTVTL